MLRSTYTEPVSGRPEKISDGEPIARSSRSAAVKLPAARVTPKESRYSALPARPELSWLHAWLRVADSLLARGVDDGHAAGIVGGADVLEGRPHGEIGLVLPVEVTGGQGVAEGVATLGLARHTRGVLGPDLAPGRGQAA